MVELLILRHAKSSWSDPELADYDRPLKKRGKRDSTNMGIYMAELKLVPDLVISSTAKRAVQTTRRSLKEMHIPLESVRWSRDLYHAEPNVWFEYLQEWGGQTARIMIVGHNPGLEDLMCQLCTADIPVPADGKLLPTAALAHLEIQGTWTELKPNSASLLSLTRPRSLVESI